MRERMHAGLLALCNMLQHGMGTADLCHLILPMGGNLFTARPDFIP